MCFANVCLSHGSQAGTKRGLGALRNYDIQSNGLCSTPRGLTLFWFYFWWLEWFEFEYNIVTSISTSIINMGHEGSKNKSCPNELNKKLLDKHIIRLSSHYLQNLSIYTSKKVLLIKKMRHVSIWDFKKNLTFWIVTRVSAHD